MRSTLTPALLVCGALLVTQHIYAAVISSNLANATEGVETASGTTWLGASFGTGSTALSLTSATLLLSGSGTSAAASLSLYSDGGLVPGSLLGNLTGPASLPSTVSAAVFLGNALSLAANSTYWLVVRALGGEISWAWTLDNSGTGSGFQHTWALSSSSGSSWFSSDIYPLQFAVSADAAATAVPEPGSLSLLTGFTIAALLWRKYDR